MDRIQLIKKLFDAGYSLSEAKKAIDILFPRRNDDFFIVVELHGDAIVRFYSNEWAHQA